MSVIAVKIAFYSSIVKVCRKAGIRGVFLSSEGEIHHPADLDVIGDRTGSFEIMSGVNIESVHAPFWKRSIALAVDYGILGACSYVIFLVGGVIFGILGVTLKKLSVTSGYAWGGFGALVVVAVLALLVFFHWYFIHWETKRGQTPGKKLFGLTVVSLDGHRLSRGQAITRELFRYLDVTLIFPEFYLFFLRKTNNA